MATLIPLGLKIQASTAGLVAGLGRAQKAIGNFAGSVVGASGRLAGYGAAITSVVAGGGLTLLVKRSFEAIDVTAKLADRLGVATNKFVGLQYAAGLAGVNAEGFGTAMEQMSKRVAESALGTGEASRALIQLGMNASELASMAPDEAFLKIADGIRAIQNPSEKALIAYQLFGRQGISLINTLNQGSDAIREQIAEAQRLGIAFNEVDGNKIQAANDAITRMQAAFTGLANTIAVQLSPYIEALANHFASVATSGTSSAGLVRVAFGEVLGVIGAIADYVKLGEAAFYGLQGVATAQAAIIVGTINNIGKAFVELVNTVTGSSIEWSQTIDMMSKNLADAAVTAFDKAGDAYNEFASGANSKKAIDLLNEIDASATKSAMAIAANAKAMHENRAAITDMAAAAEAASSAQQDLAREAQRVIDATRTPLEKYEATISKLSELLNAGLIDWETYGRAVQQARADLEGVAESQNRVRSIGDISAQDMRGASRTGQFSTTFAAGATALAKAQTQTARNTDSMAKGIDKMNRTLASIDGKTAPVGTEAF